MSCNDCSGVFFRQLSTEIVPLADSALHIVPLNPPMIPYSWWKTGRRMVFSIPVKGVLYANTVFGIRLRDNTAMTNFEIGSFEAQAGSEVESFQMVCDVVEIDNSEVTFRCWLNYDFPIGLETPANPFFDSTFDNSFRPMSVQVYVQQAEVVESELTFQNAQFTGMAKAEDLVC